MLGQVNITLKRDVSVGTGKHNFEVHITCTIISALSLSCHESHQNNYYIVSRGALIVSRPSNCLCLNHSSKIITLFYFFAQF